MKTLFTFALTLLLAVSIYADVTIDRFRAGELSSFVELVVKPVTELEFSGTGTGTADDPYVITTPDQLNQVRNYPDSDFVLGNDINMDVAPYNSGEGWQPIGDGRLAIPFTGTFDGRGMTIIHLLINRNLPYQGLFGYVANAEISNVTILNSSIQANSNVGMLIGYSFGTVILNCQATGNITGNSDHIGGLVGYAEESTLTKCHTNVSLSGRANVGGLVGIATFLDDIYATRISKCFSEGDVSGDTSVGGLIGSCVQAVLESSYSNSIVTPVYGGGGLVGYMQATNISNCYATGSVTSASNYAGGLVGYSLENQYTNCYATGLIGLSENRGGLIAIDQGNLSTATACYWDTNESACETSQGGSNVIGRFTYEMTYPYAANTFDGWCLTLEWVPDSDYTLNNGYPALNWAGYDYPNGVDVWIGEYIVTVTGGNANNGSGYIPNFTDPSFVPVQSFTFVGSGEFTVTIITGKQWGAYWQNGTWNNVANNGGQVVFELYFGTNVEIPIVLGDEPASLAGKHSSNNTPNLTLTTSLNNVYPNPFNPSTTVSFSLAESENVSIKIFNIKGQLVRNLASGIRQIGEYRVIWDGKNDNGQAIASGMYFLRMQAGDYTKTTKLAMLK